DILLRNGFGFLVVANGRLDKEILRAQKSGKPPAALAREDAAAAVAAAQREGFPPHTILFLEQEEGGRMLPEQADYLLAWTEAVTGTTIQDIRQRVAAGHLHPIAFWVAQDACPPAPGCVIQFAPPPSPNFS